MIAYPAKITGLSLPLPSFFATQLLKSIDDTTAMLHMGSILRLATFGISVGGLSCISPKAPNDSELGVIRSEASGGEPRWVDQTTFEIKGPCSKTEARAKNIGGRYAAWSAAHLWWLNNTPEGKECDPKVSAIFKDQGVKDSTIYLCGSFLPEPIVYEPCTYSEFEGRIRARFMVNAAKLTFVCDNLFVDPPLVDPAGNVIPGKTLGFLRHIRGCPDGNFDGFRLGNISLDPQDFLPPGYQRK